MKVQLKDYQIQCIQTIENHFKKNSTQLIQLPTGAGKTFIFLNYLKNNSINGLIICPSIEIQEQIYKWAKFFLTHSIVRMKIKSSEKGNFYILTAASLNYEKTYKELLKRNFDTIVIDEAHRSHAKTYINFLERMEGKKFNLLGCTATPERLDGKCLLDIFGQLTFDINLLDLINCDQLCDIKGYRIQTGDKLNNYICANGDFKPIELRRLDNESRNSLIFKTFEENCKNKKSIIFCLNIEHCEKIANYLNQRGYKASCIHGNMGKNQRAEILSKYKSGDIQVITNCQLLTEGFDEPSIECIIIARPTRSKSLYCQMIGRGVRKYDGKELCYLYELTDNNHDICTFNVAAGKESDFLYDYKQGIRLTDLKKEIEKISLKDVLLNKKQFNIFNTSCDGKINLFESLFISTSAFEWQINRLNEMGISYFHPINVLEAEFLIWKHKAFFKYGIYKRDTRKI